MSKNPPPVGGPSVPNAASVLMRQRLSRAAALLPVTLLLPLMLLGMQPRPLPPEQTRGAEQAEHVRLLRRDLQKATARAAHWRAVARRSGGRDTRAARRARCWGGKVVWRTRHLAALRL